MATKKDLLGNALMHEIVRIRIDTLWNILALRSAGRMPPVDAEKATGDFDDKGALFIPRGVVLQDWEGKDIVTERYHDKTSDSFRRVVRRAMQRDGAHLFGPDGFAASVKLGNTAFAKIAAAILENRREALRRGRIGEKRPARISSADISRSYCPTWIPSPYGSRTSLSSDISVCMSEPRMYFQQCLDYYDLRADEADRLWEGIKAARQSLVGAGGDVLAPPVVVTCHNTRYREASFTGLTRISGYGRFGEFATLTLEELSSELLGEIESGRVNATDDEIVAEFEDLRIVLVLRVYPRTSPGARLLKGVSAALVSVEKELGLDLAKITSKARRRYRI